MKTEDRAAADIAERIDAYLDGLLSPSETRATERLLAQPEGAAALAEALALREILASTMPGDEPPAGLADRIITALGVEGRDLVVVPPPPEVEEKEERSYYGARSAFAGMGTMRYALPPLRLVGGEEREDKRPWWRRTLLGRRS